MTAGQTADRTDGRGVPPTGVSRWADLDGPVHYLDFGGPADGPVVVCVHGLGGNAVNWAAIAPLLTGTCRVLAPDLAGHGLTQSLGRGTDVTANRVLLHRFVTSVTGAPVILMGNSMGGMISLLEASAAPAAVAGLVLVDPAVPFALARPDPAVAAMFALYLTPGLRRAVQARRYRQTPAELVAGILRLCCADPSRVAPEVLARHVEVATQRASFPGIEADFAAAMRSVVRTVGYPHGRAYSQRIRSVACPVLLIHGTTDRLVPLGAARAAARANPTWSVREFPGVGHVPQLEVPQDTADAALEWLGSAGQHAARAARAARTAGPATDGANMA
jgi:pimeloyl-ACP methyl ester carboxylesterase